MAEAPTNQFLEEVVTIYDQLLSKTATNVFYTNTKSDIETAINSLSINDEKKAEMLITLNSNLAASTISKAMDQSIIICDKAGKIPLENSLLQAQIDNENKTIELKTAQITSISKDDIIKEKQANKLDNEMDLILEQINELKESVLDRQGKRPVEITNLTKQGELIDAQVNKMLEDKLYVIAQKLSMLEQVEHNKMIKAMDAMADMIGTLGAGGLKPSTKMFEIFFEINKLLTGIIIPLQSTDLTITKA